MRGVHDDDLAVAQCVPPPFLCPLSSLGLTSRAPLEAQRREYEGLRGWLVRSCQLAGIAPPERALPLSLGARPAGAVVRPLDPLVFATPPSDALPDGRMG